MKTTFDSTFLLLLVDEYAKPPSKKGYTPDVHEIDLRI